MGRTMRVLVACEESQEVCKAFRAKGHEAYSCDLLNCSGGHPEWHIKGDCLPLLNGNCTFVTEGGEQVYIDGKWDLLIAHPPCTYLTNTGNSWFEVEKYGRKAQERWKNRVEAAVFFMRFVAADCDKIAVENPVGIMNTAYRSPDCIVHPYHFGDDAKKKTCFWLKGLPPLVPTNIIIPTTVKTGNSTDSPWHAYTWSLPPAERARARSRTWHGMAVAMSELWG